MAEDLVLGHQRRGRVLGQHVAVVEAAVGGQEGRQLGELAGQQAEGAALADAGDLGHGHRRQVERQSERLAVEVAGADHVAGVGKDERVVGHRLDLDGDHLAQPAVGVAAGAVHLRDAADRVGVLHLVAVEVAEHDLAALGGVAHVARRVQLAGDRAQLLDTVRERADRAAQTLDAHGADQVGRVEQRLAVGDRQAADGGHELGAVEEGEALLGFERDAARGRPLRGRGRAGRRAPSAREARSAARRGVVCNQQLALADHRQHEVRRRRQVAARPQRAARRHPGHEIGVEHGAEQLQRLGTHARVAPGERVDADRHRRAHDVARQRLADADGVAAHQVLLQLADLVDGDVRRGELAEAGGHAVDDALLGDDLLDDVARAGDAVERGCAELDRPARARHRDHVGDAQRRVADDERLHSTTIGRSIPPSRAAAIASGYPASA